jgi:hypothetical protein
MNITLGEKGNRLISLVTKYLFQFTLILNIGFLFSTKFYPSMDGPAHLYNSNIVTEILKGNSSLKEFYTLNSVIIPNWLSHFIMTVFRFFLPAWLAEKSLLIIYVSGTALSFRYLIRILNPTNIALSIFIFPFIYSFLFHLGFYNFCLSFSLFFLTLGYWLKHFESKIKSKHLILMFLFLVTYFSNLLTFIFLGFTIALFILYFSFQRTASEKKYFFSFKPFREEILKLFFYALPGLILLVLFYFNVTFFPSNEKYSTFKLIKWLNDVRPLIVYNYEHEEVFTEHYFHLLLLLFFLSFLNFENKKISVFLKKADLLVIPLLIITALYFTVPNGSSAGMMTERYCLMIYFFMLLWLVSRSVKSFFNVLITAVILFLHFWLLYLHMNDTIKNLDLNARSIVNASKYLKENSIVLPINLSDNWLEPHFSNYLGVEKPLVILENYEASVGWFPVKWKEKDFPNIQLNHNNAISGIQWINNVASKTKKQINYVVLYGNINNINNDNWNELKNQLVNRFKLIYRSKNQYVEFYKYKQK